ncbi:MAG: ferric reductase-like transmembrane domain-containing protein [Candidatus Pacearchaeota archaeon]|jgi:predicted ferric reductase
MQDYKAKLGQLLILILSLITILIWFIVRLGTPIFDNYSIITHSFGQLLGLVGMTLFSLSFLLTTRFKFIEGLFGGLDKVYNFHHLVGITSFILILFHPILLVLKFIPSDITQAAKYLLPSSNWAVNLGIFSLSIMIILIVLTLYINIKYQNWKVSHKFMGLAYILSCFHIFLVYTDITYYPLLKYYMIFIVIIGLISFLYESFIRNYFGNLFIYEVSSIEIKEKITIIELIPKKRQLDHIPGQFIFIRFFDKSLSKESHPFTIASAPSNGKIRLAIKSLGDFTEKLKTIKIGTLVEIEGPYGKFDCRIDNDQIWIAGSIGITPFLSFAESLENKQCKINNVDLYYAVKNSSEAIFLDKLKKISSKVKGLNIITNFSETHGHLDLEKIIVSSKTLKNKDIFICGPPTMVAKIVSQLRNFGVKEDNIHREDFNLDKIYFNNYLN